MSRSSTLAPWPTSCFFSGTRRASTYQQLHFKLRCGRMWAVHTSVRGCSHEAWDLNSRKDGTCVQCTTLRTQAYNAYCTTHGSMAPFPAFPAFLDAASWMFYVRSMYTRGLCDDDSVLPSGMAHRQLHHPLLWGTGLSNGPAFGHDMDSTGSIPVAWAREALKRSLGREREALMRSLWRDRL